MNFKKVLSFAIGPIGAACIGIFTIPILAWQFSVEDIGRFSILQLIMSFSCILFTLGLDQAFVREYNEYDEKSDLLKTVILTSIGIFFFIAFIFSLNPNYFSKLVYGISSLYLFLMTLFCVLMTLLLRYLSLLIRMQEKGFLYSISQIIPKLFLFLSIVFLLILKSHFNSFYDLIAIQTISLLIVFVILFYFIKDDLKKVFIAKFNYQLLRKMLGFGIPLVVSGLVFWLMQSCAKIILLKFSTLSELGIFSVATSIAAGFSVLSAIFNTIWTPIIYKLIEKGEGVKQVEWVSEIIALIITFICCMICLVLPLISELLPIAYRDIGYIILLCVLQPLFYTLSEATMVGILIKRETRKTIYISVVGLLINLLLLLCLTPILGVLGAGISISISFWFYFVLRTEFSRRVWVDFKRAKVYLSTLLCLILSIIISLNDFEFYLVAISFIKLLMFNCLLFKSSLAFLFNKILFKARTL